MNTWKKVGDAWCVVCPEPHKYGDVVTVTNRAGESKQATLDRLVQSARSGDVWTVAPQAKAPAPAAQAVGDLTGVLALFARPKAKFPAIVVAVEGPKDADGKPTIKLTYRVSVAGARAKVPGSLNVCDDDRWVETDFGTKREWLGRVLVDGTYEPARAANGRTEDITASLREFAKDPAAAAKRSARLTGRCVFCNAALGGDNPSSPSGQRSLAVGYGQTCAKNYGLPWGEEKLDLRAEAVPASRVEGR